VSDVVQVENSALAIYVECHEDLIMTKVKQHLYKKENNSTTKAIVVDRHIAQWHSKALHGQWPGLLLKRSVHAVFCLAYKGIS